MMKKKKKNLKEIILPNKKINLFVTTILVLGIISGSIFLIIANDADKTSAIQQITTFMDNIKNNNIHDGQALRNSLIINYLFIFLIWSLGLSIIGVFVNLFITYIKGFLVGFSIASIFLTYKYKGIVMAILYTFPCQVINIITTLTLSIYSIMFAGNLLKIITSKKSNSRIMLKKYLVILALCIILAFISSVLEVYLFPNLLKFIINFYT